LQVTKVFYDCRCDSSALHFEQNVDPEGVLDLQLANSALFLAGPSYNSEDYRQKTLKTFFGEMEVRANPEAYLPISFYFYFVLFSFIFYTTHDRYYCCKATTISR